MQSAHQHAIDTPDTTLSTDTPDTTLSTDTPDTTLSTDTPDTTLSTDTPDTIRQPTRPTDAVPEGDLRPHLGVSIHIQGMFLLILLLLAFWSMLEWGSGVITDALHGEKGAIVARTSSAKPGGSGISDDSLDNAEVIAMQTALTEAGYEPGPIDGIMGDLTRSAMNQARTALGLTGHSDRTLLEELIDST